MASLPRNELALVAAYLLGSLSFAIVLVRVFRGSDIRREGSGNAGATNVLRTSGKALAVATLLLDALKGSLAVLLMRAVTYDPWWIGAAAAAAILGHMFPIFFGFKGGKGVATAVGAFAVIEPLAVLVLFVVFAAVVSLTRYVSLGSISAACLLPVSVGILFHRGEAEIRTAAAAAILLLISHRANIRRLLEGTERKLGPKEPPAP